MYSFLNILEMIMYPKAKANKKPKEYHRISIEKDFGGIFIGLNISPKEMLWKMEY